MSIRRVIRVDVIARRLGWIRGFENAGEPRRMRMQSETVGSGTSKIFQVCNSGSRANLQWRWGQAVPNPEHPTKLDVPHCQC